MDDDWGYPSDLGNLHIGVMNLMHSNESAKIIDAIIWKMWSAMILCCSFSFPPACPSPPPPPASPSSSLSSFLFFFFFFFYFLLHTSYFFFLVLCCHLLRSFLLAPCLTPPLSYVSSSHVFLCIPFLSFLFYLFRFLLLVFLPCLSFFPFSRRVTL